VQWGGYSAYDAWFAADLNNAQLATVATYNNLVPAFEALLRTGNGDLGAFYERAAQLAALPYEERRRQLPVLESAPQIR
jgi:predicted aminopeptidase